jgi:hypothetical protein
MVVRVGNQDVIGKPLSILRTMIPGPIGSYCKLGFLRGGVALNSNAVQVCCILGFVLFLNAVLRLSANAGEEYLL